MSDAFEKGYLGTDDVIHREKVTFRAAFVIVGTLSLASGVFSAVGFVAAAGGDLQALVGGAFFLAVCGVLGLASVVGSVLRTIVTEREVVLHAGVRHEVRIPLAGVTGIGLTLYDAEARRRVLAEGKGAFAAIHPKKQLVRIEWLDAAGKDHVAYVASEAPEVLADVVRRASVAAKAPGVRVRVAEAPETEALAEAAEATEAEPGKRERDGAA